jgi:hypothetical protein
MHHSDQSIDPNSCRFFVDNTASRWKDKTYDLRSADFDDFVTGFVEVHIHMGALTKRTEYLNSLNQQDDSMLFNPPIYFFFFTKYA